ncbi:MAG: hypothetical protein J6K00_02040 [Oscillospiraceae bacterium]|nr:hypothetical protein [Oscillospiraceae bacterium]
MLNRIFQHLEWKKLRMILEYAVYMMLVMLLQSLLFSKISILGAKGFIIPAAAVAAGIYLGGVRGAVFGIFLGLFTDMAFPETTVLFTVLFPMIGFGAGFASEFYINKSFFAFMIFSTAAILLTGLVQLAAALISGGTEIVAGLVTVLLQTLLSIPPVMLLYLPFRNSRSVMRR